MKRASDFRNVLFLSLALLAACVISPYSKAADNEDNATQNTQDTQRVTGTVAKVSFVFSTIMISCELGYVTFSVPDNTTIMRGPQEIGLEGIKTEETVTIQYRHPSPSEYVAVFIRASEQSTE